MLVSDLTPHIIYWTLEIKLEWKNCVEKSVLLIVEEVDYFKYLRAILCKNSKMEHGILGSSLHGRKTNNNIILY